MTLRTSCWIGCMVAFGLVPYRAGAPAVADPSHGRARPASVVGQEVPVGETYRRQCAACHGERGRGDGRMARRFKPPPADFRDPEGVAARSDEEVMQIIAEGQASMPAFGDVLSVDAIAALVTYVRDLSRDTEL